MPKYSYSCKECGKLYSEIREIDQNQYFSVCDSCGGEYQLAE